MQSCAAWLAQRLTKDALSCCLRTAQASWSSAPRRLHSSMPPSVISLRGAYGQYAFRVFVDTNPDGNTVPYVPKDEVEKIIHDGAKADVLEEWPAAMITKLDLPRNIYGQDHSRLYDLRMFDDEDRELVRQGCKLIGPEYDAFMKACATPFPRIRNAPQLFPPTSRMDLSHVQLELIRRSNISMPCQKGQRVFGTVHTVAKNKVWIDAGHSTLSVLNRKELSVRNVVGHTVSLDRRAGERDVRPGDRFVLRVRSLKCPLGGIWLEPVKYDQEALRAEVWEEIKDAFKCNRSVRGRILNRVAGGFAVGVAGYVGRLDMYRADPNKVEKLGALQDFIIVYVSQTPSGKIYLDLAHEGHTGPVRSPAVDPIQRYKRHASDAFTFDP